MSKKRLLRHMMGVGSLLLFLVACGTPQPTPTPVPPATTPIQPTITPVPPTTTPLTPTDTPPPEIIQASRDSITVGEFECRFVQIAFDEAIFGSAPTAMETGDQILFLEFALIEGEKEAFANLMPEIVLESGLRQLPAAWIGDNYVNVLATMTYTGTASKFSPGETSITLAYVVPQNPGILLLEFPSGFLIDLTPLMP